MLKETRRRALGLFAAAPAAIAALAAAEPAKAATLAEEFEAAWAAERAADDADDLESLAYETAYARTSAVVQRILASSAQGLADLKLKARAVLWCYAGDVREMLDVFDEGAETTDTQIVASILRDLIALSDTTGGTNV